MISSECRLNVVIGCKAILSNVLRAALQRGALLVADVVEFAVAMFDFRNGSNKLVLRLFRAKPVSAANIFASRLLSYVKV